jgi:hypothetical protein
MALDTSAGTETLHSALFEDVNTTPVSLITGVQYHIYTVLSVTARKVGNSGTSNNVSLHFTGYDSTAGTSAQPIELAYWTAATTGETFVFNDKFSFNGYEPSSNTQAARAAQAGSVAQYLKIYTSHADCKLDVTVTFIDQNNS